LFQLLDYCDVLEFKLQDTLGMLKPKEKTMHTESKATRAEVIVNKLEELAKELAHIDRASQNLLLNILGDCPKDTEVAASENYDKPNCFFSCIELALCRFENDVSNIKRYLKILGEDTALVKIGRPQNQREEI
jgi:hypothetical protein